MILYHLCRHSSVLYCKCTVVTGHGYSYLPTLLYISRSESRFGKLSQHPQFCTVPVVFTGRGYITVPGCNIPVIVTVLCCSVSVIVTLCCSVSVIVTVICCSVSVIVTDLCCSVSVIVTVLYGNISVIVTVLAVTYQPLLNLFAVIIVTALCSNVSSVFTMTITNTQYGPGHYLSKAKS